MAKGPTNMPRKPLSPALMPMAVDVDLVRFEKNLLQIGFFGANDGRDKNRATRRIEQIVMRNGSKIKVAAEFRGSDALGLPSTTDRDKFIALLKIISEERLKTGSISNPVRFSGYRLIQELGLSRNGEIYEDISRWGKRMTDTTITSEQVVYRAAKKVYSDETLHVFRAFRRTGNSNLNGTERQESYEVVLEDWLLENLEQRYVIPEDFNAYKQLTRPTAKGIFGNLHLWFHASSGKPVEKDYADLCNLLNIRTYPHISKIKSTMGLALDELVAIKYISKWDVQKMSSKLGYKVVLLPGEELLRILASVRPGRRDQPHLSPERTSNEQPERELSVEEEEALTLLKQYGVLPIRAASLLAAVGYEVVIETVEYLAANALSSKRKSIENPAGLIVYSLEKRLPIPAAFASSRKRKAAEAARDAGYREEANRLQNELDYCEWIEQEVDRLISEQFTQSEIERKLAETVSRLTRTNEQFGRMTPKARTAFAKGLLRREVSAGSALPSFEDWKTMTAQSNLF